MKSILHRSRPFLLCAAAILLAGCATANGGDRSVECHEIDGTGAVWERYRAETDPFDPYRMRPEIARSLVIYDGGRDLPIVSAAWYGFTGVDDTTALNAAINSGASVVLIPAMETSWQTHPLSITGDHPLLIVFEPGAIVEAIEGGFTGRTDWLLTIHDRDDVRIVGYGAELRMRREDYQGGAYRRSQWRHAIAIAGSERVTVEGLTISGSGGDGVYIGVSRPHRRPARTVVLRDLTLRDHHRQGITVVSVVGLLIENAIVSGTRGHPPAAGIDFEPNQPTEYVRDVVVRDVCIRDNRGPALLFALHQFEPWSFPVDITMENVVAVGAPIAIWSKIPRYVRGTIDIGGVRTSGFRRPPRLAPH